MECNIDNAGCDHTCTDVPEGYQCTCFNGYDLYTQDRTANFSLRLTENGLLDGDVYYINHTCVRKLIYNQYCLVDWKEEKNKWWQVISLAIATWTINLGHTKV